MGISAVSHHQGTVWSGVGLARAARRWAPQSHRNSWPIRFWQKLPQSQWKPHNLKKKHIKNTSIQNWHTICINLPLLILLIHHHIILWRLRDFARAQRSNPIALQKFYLHPSNLRTAHEAARMLKTKLTHKFYDFLLRISQHWSSSRKISLFASLWHLLYQKSADVAFS